MDASSQKKVDMSLDEIIKLNRAEKKKQMKANQTRGRGANRGTGRGRGGRGRGGVVTRGGRGANGAARGRGSNLGGRGRGRGRGGALSTSNRQQQQQTSNVQGLRRGRGRGFAVNKLNRAGLHQSGRGQTRGRGRGRGGNVRTTMVFTNKTLTSPSSQQQGGLLSKQQRLNKVRQQAALLREKQQALKNLQQAQLNMQTVTQAIQQSSRDRLLNQKRGINQGNQQGARGRRKLLTSLKLQTTNPGAAQANRAQPSRQLVHTSVTIANPAAAKRGNNRRGWRKKPVQAQQGQNRQQDVFTIQVPNEKPQGKNQTQHSLILNQLKMLKPAVPTVYKFQKNVFAAPKTGLSLNDRFGSTSSLAAQDSGDMVGDRKVFM